MSVFFWRKAGANGSVQRSLGMTVGYGSVFPWRVILKLLFSMAWRNLWRHPRRTLITASTISIGLVLAIFFIGIGDGSHQAMVRQAIALGQGHITVQPTDYNTSPHNQLFLESGLNLKARIDALGLPIQVAPRIELQALASTAYQSEGVKLLGLMPANDPFITALTKHQPVQGKSLSADDPQGIWVGVGLAKRLRVGVGGKVVAVAGRQGADAVSHLFRVRGIFQTGIEALDRYTMVSSLKGSHHLLADNVSQVADAATRIAIFLQNDSALMTIRAQVASTLQSVGSRQDLMLAHQAIAVLPWQDVMPDLVQFIAVDDAGNYVFLALILVLVIFGIVNTVLMSVLERTREFGLLCALGLRPRYLWLLVSAESFLLGVFACGVGWVLGGAVHFWFATYGLDLSGVMSASTQLMGTVMSPVIYAELSTDRIMQLTTIVITATVLSGLYPAFKAARVSPLQAMRS